MLTFPLFDVKCCLLSCFDKLYDGDDLYLEETCLF